MTGPADPFQTESVLDFLCPWFAALFKGILRGVLLFSKDHWRLALPCKQLHVVVLDLWLGICLFRSVGGRGPHSSSGPVLSPASSGEPSTGIGVSPVFAGGRLFTFHLLLSL